MIKHRKEHIDIFCSLSDKKMKDLLTRNLTYKHIGSIYGVSSAIINGELAKRDLFKPKSGKMRRICDGSNVPLSKNEEDYGIRYRDNYKLITV